MTLTRHPYGEDGSDRVFVGMHRPPYESVKGERECPLGHHLLHYSLAIAWSCWNAGHFDVPLYRKEEPGPAQRLCFAAGCCDGDPDKPCYSPWLRKET